MKSIHDRVGVALRVFFPLLLAGLALTACAKQRPQADAEPGAPPADPGAAASTGEGGSSTAAAASPDAAPAVPESGRPVPQLAPARPLHATLVPDAERAAKAVLRPAGGTVEARTADGATISLVVPPGALISAVEVTLTPLRTAEGLPLSGGAIVGVQLAPEGLQLFHSATLTIDGPAPPDGARARAVAWSGEGRNVHRVPWRVVDGRRTVAVHHFSGYGVGGETPEDAAAERGRAPEGWEGQVYAEATEIIDRIVERQRADPDSPVDPADVAALDGLLRNWWEGLVAPELRGLADDPERLEAMLPDFLSWRATVEDWGQTEGFGSENRAALVGVGTALASEQERAVRGCADEEEGLENAVGAARWAATAGALGTADPFGLLGREPDARLGGCLTFSFGTTITISLPSEDGFGMTARFSMGDVSLALAAPSPGAAASGGGLPPVEGSGELRYDSFDFELDGGDECHAAGVQTTPGQAVARLELDVNPRRRTLGAPSGSPSVAGMPDQSSPVPVPLPVMGMNPTAYPNESFQVVCDRIAVRMKTVGVRAVWGDAAGTLKEIVSVAASGPTRPIFRAPVSMVVPVGGMNFNVHAEHIVQHTPSAP
ncbi:MAG: hypothetical protein JXB32_09750 [Deltaproteobacteria bacterium]|nr:hypothetical protein [Deltaproteobacteria bacterium]